MITNEKEMFKRAKFLYVMAWIIEILAVIVGFIIALSTIEMLSNFESNGNKISTNDIILSGLAFFMVALVEITKIPFAYAFYKSRRIIWKLIFGASLLFLMVITFESAMNGFSRGFTIQKAPIEAKHNEISNLENLNIKLYSEIKELLKYDRENINKIYKDDKDELLRKIDYIKSQKIFGEEKQLQNSIKSTAEEIIFLKKELEDKIANTRKINSTQNSRLLESLSSSRNDYNKDITALQNEEKKRIDEEKKATDSKINQLEKKIDNYKKDKENRNKELEDDWNNDSDIEKNNKKYNDLISLEKDKIINFINIRDKNVKNIQNNFDKKINEVRAKISSLDAQITKINQSTVQPKIDDINKEFKSKISELNIKKSQYESELVVIQKTKNDDKQSRLNDLEKQILNLENKYRTELLVLEKNLTIINSKKQLISDNKKAIGDYKIKINLEGATIPVYNFTIWAYSGSVIENQSDINKKVRYISDLSTRQVDYIAALWFGSLAAIVAWTGIFLALASFVLQDDARTKKTRNILNIFRGIRIIIVRLYNYLKNKKRFQKDSNRLTKASRSFRRFFATLYLRNKKVKLKIVEKEIPIKIEKIVTRDVEVIKEIPVEKIVNKEVEIIKEVPVDKLVFKEVPKEVIKHEYIYVPLYTNDTSLLNTSGKPTTKFNDMDESK